MTPLEISCRELARQAIETYPNIDKSFLITLEKNIPDKTYVAIFLHFLDSMCFNKSIKVNIIDRVRKHLLDADSQIAICSYLIDEIRYLLKE